MTLPTIASAVTATFVTLTWAADSKAEGYRVFYAPQQNPGAAINRLELPVGQSSLSVVLASGQKFFVSVQGHSALCDGPQSTLVAVNVP